ncbi:hypothetical protein ACFU8R_23060 [Pseudonocardia alni]|uniref:hypothetical protein n=1 Tax=Pseudonocardia alni TaxID=33907 RepID=UPI003316577C
MSPDVRRNIVSYGACVPYHRLDRTAIRASLGQGGGVGTRTVAAYDDKPNATAIHAALGGSREGFATDLGAAVRGASGALQAAAATGGMAVLSDIRTGRPGSADESAGGDGAVAFAFGSSTAPGCPTARPRP